MSQSQYLRGIDQRVQKWWIQNKIFEAVPDETKPKYFATFPYPYMNGQLHLGHALTMCRAEFACQYQRQQGKQVLFPFAFHATGMPIKAGADKLKAELEGNTPIETSKTASKSKSSGYHSKRQKLANKEGQTQLETMQLMGIPEDEIPKFTDPHYWPKYFIPKCQKDVSSLGMGIDWRRQFTTTELEPHYDKFVKWQFQKLYQSQKLVFADKFTVWSLKDNQACMDHDRSVGEGVQPDEFTLIPFQLYEPLKISFLLTHEDVKGRSVYLLATTNRPDNALLSTGLWVSHDMSYGVYVHNYKDNPEDIVIVSDRAYKQMIHQGHTMEFLMYLNGKELMGHQVYSTVLKPCLLEPKTIPFDRQKFYILPLMSLNKNKGTGIEMITSGESVRDYLVMNELINNSQLLKDITTTFNVTKKMIPQIATQNYTSKYTSVIIDYVESYCLMGAKISNEEFEYIDKQILDIIKKEKSANLTRYKNLMMDVSNMIDANKWFEYAELRQEVISRSGDKCVVSRNTDQIGIDYGEPIWKRQLEKHLAKMEFYSEKLSNQFNISKDWLKRWNCVRSCGLGTKMPSIDGFYDGSKNYLIDSLSDSTVYMALYTIYHQLTQIPAESVDCQMFDYIFLDKDFPEDSKHCDESYLPLLKSMRKEFNYWYPMDLRVSGKDLIQNHLLFCLYNHIVIWNNDESKLPKSYRTNGHITINKNKMSKSEGNFITVSDALEKYSADVIRLSLSTGNDDPTDDINFEVSDRSNELTLLSGSISSLHSLLVFMEINITKLKKNPAEFRSGEFNLFDQVMLKQLKESVDKTSSHLDKLRFNEAVQSSYYFLVNNQSKYFASVNNKPHRKVIELYIDIFLRMLTPIIPHITEYCWQLWKFKPKNDRSDKSDGSDYMNFNINDVLESLDKLNDPEVSFKSIRFERFPTSAEVDILLDVDVNLMIGQKRYLEIVKNKLNKMVKMWKKRKLPINSCQISVGDYIIDWQHVIFKIMETEVEKNNDTTIKDLSIILKDHPDIKQFNLDFKREVMPYVSNMLKQKNQWKTDKNFDRFQFLKSVKDTLEKMYGFEILILYKETIQSEKPEIMFH